MKKKRQSLLSIMLLATQATAGTMGSPVQVAVAPAGQYVCYDGRMLNMTSTGWLWKAKRGCFISKFPCCKYEALQYGVYRDRHSLDFAFEQCREGYPFHWGEMQTH